MIFDTHSLVRKILIVYSIMKFSIADVAGSVW